MKKSSLSNRLLNILFPIECVGCGVEDVWLCEECSAKIKLTEEDKCPVCKQISATGKTHKDCREKTSLDGIIVCAKYNDQLLQDVVYKYKYNFVKSLATPLSKIMIDKIKELDQAEKPGLVFNSKLIVMPVPLHKRRFRWRDFNQAELLARNLANKLNLLLRPYILERKKYTQSQIELKKENRLKNVRGAFRVNKEWRDKLKNTKILLVDDVMTTGSTLNECTRILKDHGALEVWAIVLARG